MYIAFTPSAQENPTFQEWLKDLSYIAGRKPESKPKTFDELIEGMLSDDFYQVGIGDGFASLAAVSEAQRLFFLMSHDRKDWLNWCKAVKTSLDLYRMRKKAIPMWHTAHIMQLHLTKHLSEKGKMDMTDINIPSISEKDDCEVKELSFKQQQLIIGTIWEEFKGLMSACYALREKTTADA